MRYLILALVLGVLSMPAYGQTPNQPPEPIVIVVCETEGDRDHLAEVTKDREPTRGDLGTCQITQPYPVRLLEAGGLSFTMGERYTDYAEDWIFPVRIEDTEGGVVWGLVWAPRPRRQSA